MNQLACAPYVRFARPHRTDLEHAIDRILVECLVVVIHDTRLDDIRSVDSGGCHQAADDRCAARTEERR
jgi:hypothetical protein